MRIVFMGTPAFALPVLEELFKHHQIAAIYTQPPKPAGRGYVLTKSPVHEWGESHHIPVYTPRNFKDSHDIEFFASLDADAAVVAAYGLILPKPILTAYPYGCINIHPSLLPRFRGAAPIQRAILAGDTKTGVCIMQMDEGCDTGPVFSEQQIDLDDDINFAQLHDKLAVLGGHMLLNVLNKIDTITPTPQSNEGVVYAAKLNTQDRRLNWHQEARLVQRQINAFSPKPGAECETKQGLFKIYEAKLLPNKTESQKPGIYNAELKAISCRDYYLQPILVQKAGGKPMKFDEYLRGANWIDGASIS